MTGPKSLKEQILSRKRKKREHLQEIRIVPRYGRGARRKFDFAPLPFESDRKQFDELGGAYARYPLFKDWYSPAPEVKKERFNLIAPPNFTFSSNLDGVLRFIYELRRQAFIERTFFTGNADAPQGYMNLNQIEGIDLKSALILAAEIDRVRKVMGFKPVLDDHEWAPEIRGTLYALGLHDIVHAMRRDVSVPIAGADRLSAFRSDRYEIIKMRSGTSSSNDLAKEIRDQLFEACRPFSVARPQVYNVLVEAFNNTREHAYPNGSGEDGIPSVRGWWAGAIVDHEKGAFELAVYDQGIGIPERFARQHEVSRIERRQAGGSGDMLVLQRAAQHGITSTNRRGRGNGLWQMTELTRTIADSEVQFTSLLGHVAYKNGVLSSCSVPPQRFCGTMVSWKVPFRAREGVAT